MRDKSKPPLVHCVTPGCPGYVNFLGCFDGPVGHETFKSMQYQPTQVRPSLTGLLGGQTEQFLLALKFVPCCSAACCFLGLLAAVAAQPFL